MWPPARVGLGERLARAGRRLKCTRSSGFGRRARAKGTASSSGANNNNKPRRSHTQAGILSGPPAGFLLLRPSCAAQSDRAPILANEAVSLAQASGGGGGVGGCCCWRFGATRGFPLLLLRARSHATGWPDNSPKASGRRRSYIFAHCWHERRAAPLARQIGRGLGAEARNCQAWRASERASERGKKLRESSLAQLRKRNKTAS